MPDLKPVSNAARKRQARAKLLVEQQRALQAAAGAITPFRVEELYWKERMINPDWTLAFHTESQYLQLNENDGTGHASVQSGRWQDRSGTTWSIQKFVLPNSKQAIAFTDSPGLIFLPGYLNTSEQQELIVAALHETTGPASRTNLDSHYVSPQSGWWKKYIESPEEVIRTKSTSESTHEAEAEQIVIKRVQRDLLPMSEDLLRKNHDIKQEDPTPSESVKPAAVKDLIRRLRWTIIGLEYHWGTKCYKWNKPPMPMPLSFRETCHRISSSIPSAELPLVKAAQVDTSAWQTYKPEAGVVNFYQYRDSLTAHVDQSEVDAVRPLISISLGESCIFLAGGKTRHDIPIPFLLQSGDVIIMAGDSRRVFHGVPRIIEDSCKVDFDWAQLEDGKKIAEFVKGTRLNINVRQVFSDQTEVPQAT